LGDALDEPTLEAWEEAYTFLAEVLLVRKKNFTTAKYIKGSFHQSETSLLRI